VKISREVIFVKLWGEFGSQVDVPIIIFVRSPHDIDARNDLVVYYLLILAVSKAYVPGGGTSLRGDYRTRIESGTFADNRAGRRWSIRLLDTDVAGIAGPPDAS